jgi:hypothetical protein
MILFTTMAYFYGMATISPTLGTMLGCAAMLCVAATAVPAEAQCQLCGDSKAAVAKNLQPLSIQVEASLDFSKVGLISATRGGTVQIDAETGQRTIQGSLVGLGGMPMQGSVTIRWEPHERVAVELPGSVTITSPDGATLRLSNFQTNLTNNPQIGTDGTLQFRFGALLSVDGHSDGNFRGSIPISVDYR